MNKVSVRWCPEC